MPSPEFTILGRCLCGGVRFALAPPTDFCSHCHCESCRLAHGAAFVTWTSVPEDQLRVETGPETLRAYESSPGVFREFCGTCGSGLFYRSGRTPGTVYVTVANLTTPLDRPPDSHVSFEERAAWLEGVVALPRFRAKTEEAI